MKLVSPKIMLIAAVVLAAGGSFAYKSTVLDKKVDPAHAKMVDGPTVSFREPFIVNLADSDSMHYVKLGLSVHLNRMTHDNLMKFDQIEGAEEAGGHGAAPVVSETDKNGPNNVATNPALRDAVISAVSKFSSTQLLARDGQERLKTALLAEFKRAEIDAINKLGKDYTVKTADVRRPPYYITEVYFTDFAIQ